MTKARLPALPAWTPKIIINLLKQKPGGVEEWQENCQIIVDGVDGFGLTAPGFRDCTR